MTTKEFNTGDIVEVNHLMLGSLGPALVASVDCFGATVLLFNKTGNASTEHWVFDREMTLLIKHFDMFMRQ